LLRQAISAIGCRRINSAALTVQSGGKPLKVDPNCPPDSKPK
jgi:hypothetical protein